MTINYEKKVVDGKVAVLISEGNGAGWSTWCPNAQVAEAILFDSRLVDRVEQFEQAKREAFDKGTPFGQPGPTITEELLVELYGPEGDDAYVSGNVWDLVVYWLPVGTRFKVLDDGGRGHEMIVALDDLRFTA